MAEPILHSFLLADKILIETSGKKTIVGIFTKFSVDKLPALFPPWSIYISIANISGEHEFIINLKHDDTDQIIIPISGTLSADPTGDGVEIPINIKSRMFESAGKYSIEFILDGKIIATRNFSIELQKKDDV